MKNYLELSTRTIKVQKKRAILTVIGIILSVALITGLGTLVTSWQTAFINDAIRENGDFHTAFTNVASQNVSKIVHNVAVDEAFIGFEDGYAIMAENSDVKGQPPYQYLFVNVCTSNTFGMMSVELKEGRFPTQPGEIIMDYWALANFPEGTKVGDTITLDIGSRITPDGAALTEAHWNEDEVFKKEKTITYTLVGLIKPKAIIDRNFAQTFTYLDSNALDQEKTYDVFAKLKSVKDVPQTSEAIAREAGLVLDKAKGSEIVYNEKVLRVMGESTNPILDKTMRNTLLIMILLIITATVAVIYNAFNMSVVEKVSQFGLLRCVGATPRQIRKIVYREAFTLASVGVPAGVFSGVIAIAVLIWTIKAIAPESQFSGMELTLSLPVFLGSIALGILTVFLSAWLPARRAGKVSPMEAVRNTGEFKKEKFKRISRSKLMLKLLGPEGWIAWKNIGRNRKRFYITVFSMVISIVLFIAFGSMVDYAYQAGVIDQATYPNYALRSRSYESKLFLSKEDESKLRAIPGTEIFFRYGDTNAEVSLTPEKVNTDIYTIMNSTIELDEKGQAVLYSSEFITYGNEAVALLEKFLIDGKVDVFSAGHQNEVLIVNNNMLYDPDNKRTVFKDATSLKAGDELTFSVHQKDNGVKTVTLRIAGVLSQGVFGNVKNTGGGIQIIGSEELFKDVVGEENFPQALYMQLKKGADSVSFTQYLEEYTALHPDVIFLDYDQATREYETTMLVLSIFIYGFIAVIALIGCVNIVNTISTNIILRRRELTMLKAVGADQKSIRRLVRLESIFHAIVAVIIGSVLGCLLSKLLYSVVISVREFEWNLPISQILLAVLGTLLITTLSGLIPLKRINQTVIIEGIRGEE